MQRVFLALPIPSAIGEEVASICHGLRRARWVSPENLHITLQFLGERSMDEIEEICETMDQIDTAAFELSLHAPGSFMRQNQPATLWLHCHPEEQIIQLGEQVRSKLRGAGFKTEKRSFQPHTTIARLKGSPPDQVRQYIETFQTFQSDSFFVDHFALMESRLYPDGARYETLVEFPLALLKGPVSL